MANATRVPLSVRAQEVAVGLLSQLPAAVRARMAGPEVVVDDARLAVDARLLIRSLGARPSALVVDGSPELSRAALDRSAPADARRGRSRHPRCACAVRGANWTRPCTHRRPVVIAPARWCSSTAAAG
nr:hypothetical protein [Umezawaea endophytica]